MQEFTVYERVREEQAAGKKKVGSRWAEDWKMLETGEWKRAEFSERSAVT